MYEINRFISLRHGLLKDDGSITESLNKIIEKRLTTISI